MQTNLAQKVRERAYQMWQSEGKIEGRDLDHWCAAEREVVTMGEAGPAQLAKPKTKTRKTAARRA